MPGKKYDVYVQKGKPWWKFITGILFSNLGLFCICMAYAVAGAYMFIAIEHPNEVNQRQLKLNKSQEVDSAIVYLKKQFWEYATSKSYNYSYDEYTATVYSDLNALKLFVIDYYQNYGYDMTTDWTWSWTFPNALLFTFSIITTIGYGNVFPQTDLAKIMVIFYALIGIPMLLVFMGGVGDIMAKAVKYTYSRLCCRWCRVRRRDAELPPDVDRKKRGVTLDDVGKEAYMPTDNIMVPIMVNLVLIFIFLFGGALVFGSWEGWNLTKSIYFCFVTLATIGYGDVLPDKSFTEASGSFVGVLKMIFTVLYMIFGIMLISLALSLMQEQIVEKAKWVAREIGMDSDDTDVEPVKVSKEERVRQTPADMTGNELDFNEKRLVGSSSRAQQFV